ncbi:helix-turn-helix domain-containing protein [Spirillospora sp. CA-142024]|uniref:helix-turn-helix domain-containing protein n=1 Tax=Spirillospora sp. CA-142024 TaxID=3240036 RepID=UPI003D91C7F6
MGSIMSLAGTGNNSLEGMNGVWHKRVNFPDALRSVRQRHRLSRLALAQRAGTTQRHISFMESGRSRPGRSRPGRSMVVRLGESMKLTLRERNELLRCAGYAPVYPQTPLEDPGLEHARTALRLVLAGRQPYPAIVVDSRHELVLANDAFSLLTEGAAEHLLHPPVNVLVLGTSCTPRAWHRASSARRSRRSTSSTASCPTACTRSWPTMYPRGGARPRGLRSPCGCARRAVSCG